MLDERLLTALADGQFHSGQEIGALLGVSRSAIWKQMKTLESLGVEVYSIRGRGYRIPGGLELLCEEKIANGCSQSVVGDLQKIEVHRLLDSTNLQAMRELQAGASSGQLFLAEYQTAGKGRRGRTWVSPFGRNLYFSLIWSFAAGAAGLEGLSLVVGVALHRALCDLGLDQVGLKWPNDLLVDQKKLAGILLEMQGDASGECQVVIGVGVNVHMPDEAHDQIDQPWTDLSRLVGRSVSRNQLMATILNHLVPALNLFAQEGFAPFKQDWHEAHAHQSQRVTLISGHQEISGICLGVDDHGAIVIEHADGKEAFYAGEVSLRGHHAA